jgi:hypothetical protein
MPRLLIAICCLLLLNQCNEKEVLLPVIPIDGIERIENHSSIWIFFETSDGEALAVLNKNNKLINTNWIFNIDRRLPMNQLIPQLEILQRDRNKDSMHKKEGMKNFFSYADTKNERISLVEFQEIEFAESNGSEGTTPIARDSTCLVPLHISGESLQVGGRNYSLDRVNEIRELIATCDSTSAAYFQLQYSGELSFQQYLSVRAALASAELPIDNTEVIHTLK